MILPKAERDTTPWQHALEILIEADQGHNPIMFAQTAVNRALSANEDPRYGPGQAVGPKVEFLNWLSWRGIDNTGYAITSGSGTG